MEVIKEINDLLKRYEQVSDINSYIDIRKQLTSQYGYLNGLLSKAQEEYTKAEYNRKTMYTQALFNSKETTMNAKGLDADMATLDQKKIEMEAKNMANRLKNLKDTVEKHLSALQQDIASLRTENKHIN